MHLIPRGLVVLRSLHVTDWVFGLAGSSMMGVLLGVSTWVWHRPGNESMGFGLVGFVCGFVMWVVYQALWGHARPYPPPLRWRRHLPWGILWNFEGFLVASHSEGITYIRCVQIRGFNRSRRFIHLRSARIVSGVTAKSVPALVQTSSGYVLPSDKAIRIPPKAEFKIHVLFDSADPGRSGEGIRKDGFLRDYSRFYFMAGYNHTLFIKEFNTAHIHTELDQLKLKSE